MGIAKSCSVVVFFIVCVAIDRLMETMIKSKPLGQLVLLSCGIATSIPEAYQRSHLLRSLHLFQWDA